MAERVLLNGVSQNAKIHPLRCSFALEAWNQGDLGYTLAETQVPFEKVINSELILLTPTFEGLEGCQSILATT